MARGTKLKELLSPRQNQPISIGPFQTAPMGFGTWSWGNKFLWNYSEQDDKEIQEVFNLLVSRGINLYDTADSYGEQLAAALA